VEIANWDKVPLKWKVKHFEKQLDLQLLKLNFLAMTKQVSSILIPAFSHIQFVIDSVITELLSKYQDLDYDRHFMH